MWRQVIVALLTFHFAIAQEIPTYTSFHLVQYPATADMMDVDTVDLKPTRRFSFKTQRIPFAFREEFEKYTLKREVFIEKIGKDSITVDLQYERFEPQKHKIDYENYLIDGEKVYGHDGFGPNSFNTMMRYYLKSIRVNSNGVTRVTIPIVKPLLFTSSVGGREDIGLAVEKIVNTDLFHIDFSGSDGAGSYTGFLLFNTSGNLYSYIEDYGEGGFRPVGKDFFSANGEFQYLIRHKASLNAFELLFATDWSNRREYSAGFPPNVDQCKAIDFSEIIRTESNGYGMVGWFEERQFFLLIDDVKRDNKNPLMYHVKGIDKLGKSISRFEGQMEIKYLNLQQSDQAIVTGNLVFQEHSSQKGSGAFNGAFRITIHGLGEDLSKRIGNKPKIETFYNGSFKLYNNYNVKIFGCGNTPMYEVDSNLLGWWKKVK